MSYLLAVPSVFPGGLEAANGMHFGHSEMYTIVEIEGKDIKSVDTMANPPHEEGGCMRPVGLLSERGVRVMLCGGMGMRPLMGFQQAGIEVYHAGTCKTVKEAVQAYLDGKLLPFGQDMTCKHHHH